MLNALYELDLQWFFAINRGMGNAFFDSLLPWCRTPLFWVPFYLFLLVFALLHFERRTFRLFLAGMLLTVAITDVVSSQLIKKNVQRLRPCNTHLVQDYVQLRVDYCGTGYSFPSSHASNHFGIAMYLPVFFGPFFGRWTRALLLFWAFLVSFSQIYVGVHYPFDVLFGGILGGFVGWVIQAFVHKAARG
jgi:membrane-associated phospholipid phosphatase